jgi:hypothetical protein
MGRVTLANVAAMVALMIAATGVAAAKPPPPTPVTATIQAKPHPQVYCEECIRFSGRVSSPKAVCRANRILENALRYKPGSPSAGKTYREDFVTTDGQGKWSIVTSSGEPLAWFEVIVPKKRIGGVICRAAHAKVTL